MFCSHCGSQIADDSAVCPVCNAQLRPTVSNEPHVNDAPQFNQFFGYAPKSRPENSGGKSYAAIASALMVFPVLICFAIDYLWAGNHTISWSAYVFGGVMCLWMCFVLPALKPKKPALTACLCVCVMMTYLVMLAYLNGNAGWYIEYCLPICIMITVSSVLLTLLISYKVIKNEHIFSAILAEAGLLSVGFEVLFDLRRRGAVELQGSIIMLVIAISGIAIVEAVSYVIRLNKRK